MKIMENSTLAKLPALALLLVVLISSSCSKTYPDGMDRSTYTLWNDTINGSQIPLSHGRAWISGEYNAEINKLTYRIQWTDLSGNVLSVHFHGEGTGGNPEGVHTLPLSATSRNGEAVGTLSISEAEEAFLVSHQWEYDIHTDGFPAGEIRRKIALSPY